MDKKTLYEKADRAINQAFEAAKKSVKLVSEKAGETAHVTKLLVEKLALEHRVTQQFAKLGSRVYEKAVRQGQKVASQDTEIKELIEQTRRLDAELAEVEATLEAEKRQKSGGNSPS